MELRGLRAWRLRRALSQADLSTRSGVGQANLSRIEAGKQRARPSTARRLAEALSVDPAALMTDTGDGHDTGETEREQDR